MLSLFGAERMCPLAALGQLMNQSGHSTIRAGEASHSRPRGAGASRHGDKYIEDEGPNRLMLESAALTELEELGFVDLSIVCRELMDAVLVARKV